MNIEESLKKKIRDALNKMGVDLPLEQIIIEHSKDPLHGDYATNVVMKNARSFAKPPREAALALKDLINMDGISKIEVAGPGFINFFLQKNSLQAIVKKIITEGDSFGKGEAKNIKINVEFVSANPTGPLHVGHARGAAFGDSLCRILSFAGYDVTREYYINDAGNQMNRLGESLLARYKQILNLPYEMPEDGYYGDDIIEIAKQMLDEYGPRLHERKDAVSFFKEHGEEMELNDIKKDLADFGIVFDVFTSESKLRENNAIKNEIKFLTPYIQKQDKALVLKTSDFLDDKDRVILKSNGDCTYFLPDIIYHVNKMARGYDLLIDIFGADHHGYINRMKSALIMHGYSRDALEIQLIQMVRIIKNGQEMKASKRTGTAITLRELTHEVGVDAIRYFMASRAGNSHLDFDVDLALAQSENNPVYYAQYAHARLCSVLRQCDIKPDLSASHLIKESETELLKCLNNFPNIVNEAAKERAPFKITNYIHQLAEYIHHFYGQCRVNDPDDLDCSASRLALCKACQQVLKNALTLVGVSAPNKM